MNLIPERRKHGCDVCHKDTSTELFLGYNGNVLWVCGTCYNDITKKIKKKHRQDIWTKKEYIVHNL